MGEYFHGHAHKTRPRHPLYGLWSGMKVRCYNANRKDFSRYGARGIVVCDEWREDAAAFIRWAEENGWAPGLTLDRINNDGPYSPENCRWATAREQRLNRPETPNRSGLPLGVSKQRGRFFARLVIDGRSVPMGGYLTPDQASIAYETARQWRDSKVLEWRAC